MATAASELVEEQVTEVKPVRRVALTLSIDEARTLHEVLRHIGGNVETTYRKHTDAIREALEGAPVGFHPCAFTGNLQAKRLAADS